MNEKPRERKAVLRIRHRDIDLVEDALSYYLLSTQQGGPDDHEPKDIRRMRDRFSAARRRAC